jgi:hypothetical protein
MVALFKTKEEAIIALSEIKSKLEELRFSLNPFSHIGRVSSGIDWVGYRHWLKYKLVRKSTIRRIKDRLPLSREARTSYIGHAKGTASLDYITILCR